MIVQLSIGVCKRTKGWKSMTNNFTRTQARNALLSNIVTMIKDMVESVPKLKSKDVAVYYENQPKPDLDKHKYVVEVTIEFDSSEQADINPDPTIRVSGCLLYTSPSPRDRQ